MVVCRSKHRQEMAALKGDLQRLQAEAKGGVRGKDMVSMLASSFNFTLIQCVFPKRL